jgi:hypothetical protein
MKKKHHFVPQTYLRRFSCIDSPEEIWTYDMEKEEKINARISTIENTAFEKHFYSVTLPSGERIADMEDIIAGIEAKGAPILKKFLSDGLIQGQDKVDLASFIALLHVRTASFRKLYAELLIMQLQNKMYAQTMDQKQFKEAINLMEKKEGKKFSNEEIEEIKDLFLNPDKYNITFPRDLTLSALGAHDTITPILYNMNWSLLEINNDDRYFITSDNPVIKTISKANYYPQHLGLADKNVQILLPLSTKNCLMMHWRHNEPNKMIVSINGIKEINRLCAIHAERYLYAHKLDSGLQSLANKYKSARPPQIVTSGLGPNAYSKVSLRRKF